MSVCETIAERSKTLRVRQPPIFIVTLPETLGVAMSAR